MLRFALCDARGNRFPLFMWDVRQVSSLVFKKHDTLFFTMACDPIQVCYQSFSHFENIIGNVGALIKDIHVSI